MSNIVNNLKSAYLGRKTIKKYLRSIVLSVLALSILLGAPAVGVKADSSLATADLNTGLTATDLVNTLVGGGITFSDITYAGENVASGTFTGGIDTVGFNDGIILSSGNIASVVGPNTADGTSTNNAQQGDPDLQSLIPGFVTLDASVLEFDFVPETNVISFEYVFGSEEYNEYVASEYNDIFGFFVNGVNEALIPGTSIPVAINNVNGGNPYGINASYPEYFRNNDLDDGGPFIDIEMDGLTVVMRVIAIADYGATNHIKIGIADAGDSVWDSDVFIKADSFIAVNPTLTPILESHYVGDWHEAISSVFANGIPQAGVTVTFQIISGPNAGTGGFGITDDSGQATWSYRGMVEGMDTIVASINFGGATYTSNESYSNWGEAPIGAPPVADAGPDQTVEQTGYAGAFVTLDGSGSTDDGILWNPMFYTWSWSGGSYAGFDETNPTVLLPPGINTVTLAVEDGQFTATDAVVITVVDTTPPVLTVPDDVILEQETPAGTAYTLPPATATDNGDPDVTITDDAPAVFPPGITTVTFTATDDSGNTASDTTVVTVGDTTPPVLTVPDDVTLEQEAPEGTAYTLPPATATDEVDPDVTITDDAPAVFPPGITTVTFTAIDDSGNTASDTVQVTVEATEQSLSGIKEQTTNCLSMYIDESKRIEKAIKDIDKSLDSKYWLDVTHLDCKHGKKVFDYEHSAVKELMYLLKDYTTDKCGGIERIVLEYNGTGPVDIEVFLKEDRLATFTEVNTGDLLEVSATPATQGKLHSEIRLEIGGVEMAKIHTSCSQPINIGDVHGDFVIYDLGKLPPKDSKKKQLSDEALACVQESVNNLVTVDRLLAEILISELDGVVAIDPDRQDKVNKELSKAHEGLAKGDAELNEGKPDKAINQYKKAWEHASHAAKEAAKV